MRKIILALGAVATVLPMVAMPTAAEARKKRYYSSAHYRHCRYSHGTTGLIAGGAGGALLGNAIIGGPVGIAAGAVGGALGGRAIDRTITADRRCR